jgi:hypothetical protein
MAGCGISSVEFSGSVIRELVITTSHVKNGVDQCTTWTKHTADKKHYQTESCHNERAKASSHWKIKTLVKT